MLVALAHFFNGTQVMAKKVLEPQPIYRDDLNKKSQTLKNKKTTTKPRKKVRFEDEVTGKPLARKDGFIDEPTRKPLYEEEGFKLTRKPLDDEEGLGREEVIRVKIKMTKREADRLLSRCRNGGVLDFRNVAEIIDGGGRL